MATNGRNQKTALKCVIKGRTRQGTKVFTGEVSIPGLSPTQLVQVRTQQPYYSSSKAVSQAARAFAARYGTDIQIEDTTSTPTPAAGTTDAPKRGRGRPRKNAGTFQGGTTATANTAGAGV